MTETAQFRLPGRGTQHREPGGARSHHAHPPPALFRDLIPPAELRATHPGALDHRAARRVAAHRGHERHGQEQLAASRGGAVEPGLGRHPANPPGEAQRLMG